MQMVGRLEGVVGVGGNVTGDVDGVVFSEENRQPSLRQTTGLVMALSPSR